MSLRRTGKYIPAAILVLAVAGINFFPAPLAAGIVLTIPITLTLAIGALK